MKFFLSTLLIIGINGIVLSQENNVYARQADALKNKAVAEGGMTYEAILGSPYFDENYYSVFIDDLEESNEKVRYNIYTDQMEFERDGKIFNLDRKPNSVVVLNNVKQATFRFLDYKLDSKDPIGYAQVVYAGTNYILYKKETIFLDNGQLNNNMNRGETKFTFKRNPSVFILHKGNNVYEVPKSTNAFGKLFKDDQVVVYLKENKINLKDEKDLINVVRFADNSK